MYDYDVVCIGGVVDSVAAGRHGLGDGDSHDVVDEDLVAP